ncbi:MAG: LegC family aminotransferase [Cyclobacteriaceae bacterium]|nr:LegC family aminotransferase [Cyclobacteriaceae bacterium HetDA_MAG_MS6]
MFSKVVEFIRGVYNSDGIIPLHEPRFIGNEKKYLLDCIDSTMVSTSGSYIEKFEKAICEYTGSKHAISVVNGTAALHLSLLLAGVERGDLVVTQALTFVATSNAISYMGAFPLFIDVDQETLGLSSSSLNHLFAKHCTVNRFGHCIYRPTGQKIAACVPMHTFGHPAKMDEIIVLCDKYNIPIVEDASESLGSYYEEKHTGTFGLAGVISLNGNKTITSGGGGVILTQDQNFAKRANHLSKTAKRKHSWEYFHDEIGYNYRLPNINAALAYAQTEQLETYIVNKRKLAQDYKKFFQEFDIEFIWEPHRSYANFWLNALVFKDLEIRNRFLAYTNENGVLTRPVWNLMTSLPMYRNCIKEDLTNSERLSSTLVNIPSSIVLPMS